MNRGAAAADQLRNPVHRFKVDTSRSISIPQRGTSSSSYSKQEQEHSQLMDDLDSLFPAKNKGSSNSAGSSLKIRSSTRGCTKTRQHNGLTGGHVGAFTTSDKRQFRKKEQAASPEDNSSIVMLKNAVKDADIQSMQH